MSQAYPLFCSSSSPKPSPMEAKGIAVAQLGIRRRCLGRRPPCYGRVPRTHGAMYKNRVEAVLVGRACNTRRSPLSILGQRRILGAHVRKDACSPREICHDVRKRTDRTARGGYHMAEVSRGHSSRWKRAGPPERGRCIPGRTHPDEGLNGATCRMAGVNGGGE